MSLKTIVKNTNEFIGEICERSNVQNQAQFLKYLKNNLDDDEFLAIYDFAENYALVVQ